MNKQKDAVQEAIDAAVLHARQKRNAVCRSMLGAGELPMKVRIDIEYLDILIDAALKSSPVDVDVDDIIEKMKSEIQLLREAIIVNRIKMDAYKQCIETIRMDDKQRVRKNNSPNPSQLI